MVLKDIRKDYEAMRRNRTSEEAKNSTVLSDGVAFSRIVGRHLGSSALEAWQATRHECAELRKLRLKDLTPKMMTGDQILELVCMSVAFVMVFPALLFLYAWEGEVEGERTTSIEPEMNHYDVDD